MKKVQKGKGQIFSSQNRNESCDIPFHLDKLHHHFSDEEIEEWIEEYHKNKDEKIYFLRSMEAV
jgi:hypothetical protein